MYYFKITSWQMNFSLLALSPPLAVNELLELSEYLPLLHIHYLSNKIHCLIFKQQQEKITVK